MTTNENPRFDGGSDASDVKFYIRGWLLFIYWLMNVVYMIGCVGWAVFLGQSRYTLPVIWLPLVAYPVLLFLNRLVYETAIAVFEAVKHLRQIRDELRKANANQVSSDRQ